MSPTSQNDAVLVARVAAGDEDAAEALDMRFRPFLLRFLHGRVPIDDQDDLVQDVLAAAFQRLQRGGFRGESGLGTWLIGILKHKVADYRSKSIRDQASPVRISMQSDTSWPPAVLQDSWNPDAAIELERLLQSLPNFHRSVLLLNLREGWTTAEIAAATKQPVGTMGRILWEAKRMLQRSRLDVKKIPEGDDQ